jgi:hypothetical protein
MHPKEAAAAVAPFWARHVASERATLATSSQIIRPPRMCVLKKNYATTKPLNAAVVCVCVCSRRIYAET